MFWLGFVAAVVVVCLLTLFGAALVRRNPGTQWQHDEDRPLLGPGDH
jgi:hypothetical protein